MAARHDLIDAEASIEVGADQLRKKEEIRKNQKNSRKSQQQIIGFFSEPTNPPKRGDHLCNTKWVPMPKK